jgi:hypothetical protein
MRARALLNTAAALLARAGWAPLLVFVLHVFLARVLGLYILYPRLDIPTHALGGLVMAYFLSCCFAALPDGTVAPGLRGVAEVVFVFSATVTTAVVWEFAEFTADRLLDTRLQLGLADTLLDLAMGMVGAALFLSVAFRRGTLGKVAPLLE